MSVYCNSGCANNWLADRYCDQSCNVLQCGFDAGDCGIDNFHQLHRLAFEPDTRVYSLPPGELMGYFDLRTYLGDDGKIEDGSYEDNSVVRSVELVVVLM